MTSNCQLLTSLFADTLLCSLCLASFPGLRPDFISQPWRKVDFSPRLQDKVWAEAWERGYSMPSLVSVPDPNPPQHGSHLVSRVILEAIRAGVVWVWGRDYTLLCSLYPPMLSIPSYAFYTFLCSLYPPMLSIPSYALYTLLCSVCPPMLSIPSYALYTLLCSLYPPMLSIPSYALYTLLCSVYPPMLSIPWP